MKTPESAQSPEARDTVAAESLRRRDPLEALDDLMSVVEVLCPTWPTRPTFADAGPFIL